MGTNYYAHVNPCIECGKPEEKLHLGKSSGGWKFLFREQEEYFGYSQFKEFIKQDNVEIYDEYGREHDPEDLIQKIEDKQDGRSHHQHTKENDRYRDLTRFRLDTTGDGESYEFYEREFS